ncbi:MAG: hypothetical protein LBF86_06525 [Helicobacteraceae bacterium]|jgi:hypothetical protein|nr:hypothetical protein [Helicobacteraceae bacterium]
MQQDIFFHSDKSPNVDFKEKQYFEVSFETEQDIVRGNTVAVNIKILSDSIQKKYSKEK